MSQWYVNDSGREVGPLSSTDLKRMVREGRIRPDTWLRQVGQGGWIPANRVKGLFDNSGSLPDLPPPAYQPASPITHLPPGPMMAQTQPMYSQPAQPAYGQQPTQPMYAQPQPAYAPVAPPPPPRRNKATSGKGFGIPTPLIAGCGVAVALSVLFVGGLLLYFLAFADSVKSTEQIVSSSSPAVGLLKGKRGHGSGFLIDRNILATNAHNIHEEYVERLKVQFPSGGNSQEQVPVAAVIYSDPRRDIALLRLNTTRRPLTLSRDPEMRPGQDVVVLGYPNLRLTGDDPNVTPRCTVTAGKMSNEKEMRGQRFFEMNVTIHPGNSGGPAFNNYGKVIGVATMKLVNNKGQSLDGVGYFIPNSDVKRALDQVRSYTDADDRRMDDMHRARTTVVMLHTVCQVYEAGLKTLVRLLTQSGGKATPAFNDEIKRIDGTVRDLNEYLTTDVQKNVNTLASTGDNLPRGVKDKILTLWSTYRDLKRYYDNPQGTLEELRRKQIELSDRYHPLINELKPVLSMD